MTFGEYMGREWPWFVGVFGLLGVLFLLGAVAKLIYDQTKNDTVSTTIKEFKHQYRNVNGVLEYWNDASGHWLPLHSKSVNETGPTPPKFKPKWPAAPPIVSTQPTVWMTNIYNYINELHELNKDQLDMIQDLQEQIEELTK